MSLEILDQLEEKIRQAVETIQLLQLEVEELKEQKNQCNMKMSNLEMNTATGKNTFVHCWVNSTTYNYYKGLENLSLFSY